MTDLQAVWRKRSDDHVRDALASLGDYSHEAQAVIRAEQAARGLPTPVDEPIAGGELRDADRAHALVVGLVGLQWGALVYLVALQEWLPASMRGWLNDVSAVVLLGTLVAVPIAIRRLLKRLGIGSALAWFTYMPLLSLLFVLNYRSITAGWMKRRRLSSTMAGIEPLDD